MKLFTFMLGIALLATGCDRMHNNEKNDRETELQRKEEPNPDRYKRPPTNAVTDSAGTGITAGNGTEQLAEIKKDVTAKPQPQPQPDWDKKIIKNGTLGLEIKGYPKFTAALRDKIKSLGGYIAQEEQTQSEYKIENNVTVKVPVEQFDNAMTSFSTDVLKVNEKKVSSEDVTRQYIDTRTRMDAKRAVLQRYTELLRQARNMEEILNVQNEINAIQEELESAGGEAEYLKHASAFSTITLTYFEVLDPAAATDKPGSENKLFNALRTGWHGIAEIGIRLITIWPLLLAAVIGFILLKKRGKKTEVISGTTMP